LEGLSSLVSVAAMAGPEDARRSITQLQSQRRNSVVDALAALDARFAKEMLAAKSSDLESMRKVRADFLSEIATLDGVLSKTIELPVQCNLYPEKTPPPPLNPANCELYSSAVSAVKEAGIEISGIPPTFNVKVSDVAKVPRTPAPSTGVIHGFVYRIPSWLEVSITHFQTKSMISKLVAIPQLGGFGTLEVGDDDIRPGQQIVVELHPGLGSIKKVAMNSTPLTTEAAKALVTSSTNVMKVPEDVAMARLEAEKKRLELEVAIAEAKGKLEKAKQPPSE
jgi:hypothetical protein